MAVEENNNPYHNNAHFREVTALCYMLSHHGREFGRISEKHFVRRLAAAFIHDYKHDGKTNTVDGVHMPFKLEQQSFDAAKGRLIAANSMKDYMEHYAETGQLNPDLLHPRLRVLHDRKLVDSGLLIQDADLGPSASLSKRFNVEQSARLQKEWGLSEPPNKQFFFEVIVRGKVWSRSAQALVRHSTQHVIDELGLREAS